MTPAEQDRVVVQCHQCKLCSVGCPYTPERHEWALDLPRLLLRAEAMRHANGHQRVRGQITNHVLGRVDRVGRFGSMAAPVVNRVVGARAGSVTRRALAALTGVSAARPLPVFVRRRFSTWMRRRAPNVAATRRGSVTVFPSCLVEYHDVRVGEDLVAVYERAGIECSSSAAGCCGAPWLHAGDVARFRRVADANVRTLAREIRAGDGVVVVPEPRCRYVLTEDYPVYCDPALRPDAARVAAHVVDAAAHLVHVHRADGTGLDIAVPGQVPARIVYVPASHVQAMDDGFPSHDLLRLTGAEVTVVQRGAGVEGRWGLRVENEPIATAIAIGLAAAVERAVDGAPDTVVCADCSLTNATIRARTGLAAAHPLSVVARAVGIPTDGSPPPDPSPRRRGRRSNPP